MRANAKLDAAAQEKFQRNRGFLRFRRGSRLAPVGLHANLGRMALHEIKVEIPAAAAEATAEVLHECEFENWNVLEDAIAQRAWLAGILTDECAAHADWDRLAPLLAAASVVPLSAPVQRALADADWRDSYKAHFHAWRFGRLHWVPVWEREKFSLPTVSLFFDCLPVYAKFHNLLYDVP